MTSSRRAVTIAAGVGLAVTLVAVALPAVRFAYELPTLHVALDTAEGLIALLLAYLAYGRYRVDRMAGDYTLSAALLLFAMANLLLAAVPRATLAGRDVDVSTWAPVAVRLTAAAAFAASSLSPKRRVMVRGGGVALTAFVTTVVLLLTLGVVLLADALPQGIDPGAVRDELSTPHLTDAPALSVVQLASALLFAVAAIGFSRRDDPLAPWLAGGAALSVFARVNYALFPSLYSGWIYTGDFLRLGFYVLLLAGAARQISSYWDAVAAQGANDERRRIARDLHDGLAQELAFVSTQTRRLHRGADVDALVLARAAQRALDESRRAIAALSRPIDEPLDRTIAQAAREVASRRAVGVDLDLEPVPDVDADVREQLVRVVREAITNAIDHGEAQNVTVTVRGRPGLTLVVEDDGRGFDTETVAGSSAGFGLTSMRERAERVGGSFTLISAPGEGTRVEVRLP